MRRLLDRQHGDNGFTLIELLVVIIIIGILAAIAIPVFLNQRKKGYDAAAKSDLRNLASFEEIYLSDTQTYGSLAQVEALEPKVLASAGVTLTVVTYDTNLGYCLSAKHSASTKTFYYDSQNGGLQAAGSTGCQITTGGLPGGSITG